MDKWAKEVKRVSKLSLKEIQELTMIHSGLFGDVKGYPGNCPAQLQGDEKGVIPTKTWYGLGAGDKKIHPALGKLLSTILLPLDSDFKEKKDLKNFAAVHRLAERLAKRK